MLREPKDEVKYHLLAFEIYLETIKCVQTNFILFESGTLEDLIKNLNEMLRETKNLNLLV